jgi:hypothetical protein
MSEIDLTISQSAINVDLTVPTNIVDLTITGYTGPNNITTSTTTNISGILKGNGTNVIAATSDVDYASVSSVQNKASKAFAVAMAAAL